jgi:manganese/zinc/iron transport system permease protein
MNPYWGQSFWEFLLTLGKRVGKGLQGEIGLQDLATDEVQILVLILIACSASLIGIFLILRRMTMLANALSHTILLGIVLTLLLFQNMTGTFDLKFLTVAALITGALTTFTTEWVHKGLRLQEDASIGLIFTTFFALGIIGVSLFFRHAHLGIETVMGNVDALHLEDLKLAFYLFLFNLVITGGLFQRYTLFTFDPHLARNFGLPLVFLGHLMMIQTAATAIGSFRALGVFLFLCLLVVPSLTARLFTSRLKGVIFIASLIGIGAAIFSVALSRHFLSVYQISFSTGGLMSITLGACFLIGIGYRAVVKSLGNYLAYRHEKETDRSSWKHRFHWNKHS